jgi:hypothetical protein
MIIGSQNDFIQMLNEKFGIKDALGLTKKLLSNLYYGNLIPSESYNKLLLTKQDYLKLKQIDFK